MGIAERWMGHSPLPGDLPERLPRLVARLVEAGGRLVYVFGSAAPAASGEGAEDARPPDDLDLAVLGLPEEDRWEVLADLGDLLGTDRIDLVLLEAADPGVRFRIVSEGRLLHARSAEDENAFEMKVLREYQDLRPWRRIQGEHLRKRRGPWWPGGSGSWRRARGSGRTWWSGWRADRKRRTDGTTEVWRCDGRSGPGF